MKRSLGIIGIAVLITGCSFFQPVESPKPSPTPEVNFYQILSDAITKTMEIKSGSLDTTFDITFQSTPEVFDRFTANMKGNWNGDDKKSLLETTLNFDLRNPNDPSTPTHGFAKLSLAADSNQQMLRLNTINLTGEESEPINKSLQSIMGQWYKVPAENSFPFDFVSSIIEDKKGTNQELLRNSSYFHILDASLVQTSEEQAHHLLITLDKDGSKTLLRKLQENNSQNIPLNQLTDWENIVDNATFQGDIFIGKDSGFVRKLQGELTILGNKNTNQQITVALDISLHNINEHVPIATPKTDQTLDFENLFGIPSQSPQQ
ncbi:MAG: hypothetical protein A2V81_04160 [Candidatus Abawacabacteria bacterium RBG_16_42_10]|uniref:Lipoprotein n=1 Tax=Candidatus Abawacabacteria bacterium RBG_16_42_10 TaxID=1817814 RepID=A0A1F4XI59_9BACT|nr:MAG: hypothetical protein A2V81_04160 [Candidatus Abawacabacteria bacterium RBG_16_42_10]